MKLDFFESNTSKNLTYQVPKTSWIFFPNNNHCMLDLSKMQEIKMALMYFQQLPSHCYNPPHGKSKAALLDARLIHSSWRILRHHLSYCLHLVAAGRGISRVCGLERRVVAVHGLAAARRFPIHVHHDCGARQPQNRCADRLRRHLRRAGNRILGHADQSLALLHRRTSAALDHPSLADRKFIH